MKTLLLMRHAKSGFPEPGQRDFDRTLTDRGKKDAPEMGKRLRKKGIDPDLIISSPAARALKTAKDVAEEIGYAEKKIVTEEAVYDAEIEDVLHVIRGIDDKHKCVMIFGHNPAFTSMAGYLTETFIENMPTCGVLQIEFDVATWKQVAQQSGRLAWFDYPKREGAH